MDIGAVILAAGSSSRMGESKQMLRIDGETLLRKTVQTVLSSPIKHLVIVLGANQIKHRSALEGLPVDITVNDHWENGMGTSIKAGMHYLLDRAAIDAASIFVCDQPLLSAELILDLIAEYQVSGKPIVASHYSNAAGVPALFDKSLFQTLLALPDINGAKQIIMQNMPNVALVPFPGGEIDLDTIDDYKKFIKGETDPL